MTAPRTYAEALIVGMLRDQERRQPARDRRARRARERRARKRHSRRRMAQLTFPAALRTLDLEPLLHGAVIEAIRAIEWKPDAAPLELAVHSEKPPRAAA